MVGTFNSLRLDPEQQQNAQIIVGVGQQMGASADQIQGALSAAWVESNLKNIDYGDRDSVGLFQQRASWGPLSARMNPAQAANMFYSALFKAKGSTIAEQVANTQRPATEYRHLYSDAMGTAQAIFTSLTGGSNQGVTSFSGSGNVTGSTVGIDLPGGITIPSPGEALDGITGAIGGILGGVGSSVVKDFFTILFSGPIVKLFVRGMEIVAGATMMAGGTIILVKVLSDDSGATDAIKGSTDTLKKAAAVAAAPETGGASLAAASTGGGGSKRKRRQPTVIYKQPSRDELRRLGMEQRRREFNAARSGKPLPGMESFPE